MASNILVISEERVRELLNWEDTFEATKVALCSVSNGASFQNPRTFTRAENPLDVLLTMPGFLKHEKFGALGCKLITSFSGNSTRDPPMPNIMGNIALFDETSGALKAIVAATEITTWRTAAASVVATKYVRSNAKPNRILAILGSGVQGRIHAIAFQHFFNFNKVHIWNHNPNKAHALAQELNSNSARKEFNSFNNVQDCVKGADVIITATSAHEPILKLEWIQKGAHINAVGATLGHHYAELDLAIYKEAHIYIDYWAGANTELAGLLDLGITFKGEIGNVIDGSLVPSTDSDAITIFQSLGMAVEDCAMASMIYKLHQH